MNAPRKLWLWHVPLILLSAIMLLPLWWMVVAAFDPMHALIGGHLTLWPVTWNLKNFVAAWRSQPFGRYYVNSIATTIGIVTLQILTSSLAAYALAFLTFRGKRIIWGMTLLAMMIPVQAIFIPDYLILSQLNWINTYQALILPFAASAFGIFWLHQAFRNVPRALVEAMMMDGASPLTILWQLILPNTRPAVITLAVLNTVFHYGYLFWPLLVTNTAAYRVLPLGLSYFVAQQSGFMQWNLMMAAVLMTVLPMMVLFALAQRYLRAGVMHYGIRG
ncbi:MAG: carbohydrate ABC transporter permease [Sulfobacillus thermotolerans]|uniref:ABC transmembrane type-1 domain-containing protein n=1 Tax=Sulfobacillus thermotolerans TaxID=338644 RepID=A0ABN5H064_9FIRM|nr:hypothetical protein BXT84_09365 [Sulfobacillus thermotolerans]MCY0909244.1 carbohydrate ABC transporter permease [Sulfobacillus thermotolerans]